MTLSLRCLHVTVVVALVACAPADGPPMVPDPPPAGDAVGPSLASVETPASLRSLSYRPDGALYWRDDATLVLGDIDAGQLVAVSVPSGRERRIGRRGAGPGEFMLLHTAVQGRDGRTAAGDGQIARITVFRPDGTVEATVPLPGTLLEVLALEADRVRAGWIDPRGGPVVGWLDLASGDVRETIRPHELAPELQLRLPETGMVSPFLRAAVAANGTVYASHPHAYLLVAFRKGRVVRTVRRDLPAEPAERTHVEAVREGLEGMGMSPATVARAVEAARRTPRPAIGALAVDDAGRVWAVTRRGDEPRTQIDILAADGRFLGTVTVPDRVISLAIRGDRLAVRVQRSAGPDEGADGVDLYRITG